MIQGKKSKMAMFGLKTGQRRDVRGNVATFERGKFSTSRRSRQRRDVPERKVFNVTMFGTTSRCSREQ